MENKLKIKTFIFYYKTQIFLKFFNVRLIEIKNIVLCKSCIIKILQI
jgi:hypothetical protein